MVCLRRKAEDFSQNHRLSMKVVCFTAYHVRIPFKHRVRHALSEREGNDTLIVSCQLDNGVIGWGEGVPRDYVTGETIDQVWHGLLEQPWWHVWREPWRYDDELLERLRSWHPLPAAARGPRGCLGNAWRCAFELSVCDAWCRTHHLPLTQWLMQWPEVTPLRRSAPLTRLRYSAVLTGRSLWRQQMLGCALRLAGLKHVKVKLGLAGTDDVTLVRTLRRCLGSQCELRGDANGAYTVTSLPFVMDRLAPFRLAVLEQPLPHAELTYLRHTRGQWPIPIMLDESLCSELDAHLAIECGYCDQFNLRISKCGGLLPSVRIACLAQQAGLGWQIGCQVGETSILSAAGRHLACALQGWQVLEGSYDRWLLKTPLTNCRLSWGYGGWASALTAPGLGVQPNVTMLQQLTVRHLIMPLQ
ncbi:MAG: dipeptide epimerase [Planctomycetaceae bacterium]|nr:MAG: dipeptide epimerase [Planctomycetaceae bacterium]